MKESSMYKLNYIYKFFLIMPMLFHAVSGCTVSHTYVKDTFDTDEKYRVKKIALAVSPNEYDGKISRLYNEIQYDHISSKRDFIIPRFLYDVTVNNLADTCKKYPDLNGIIITEFRELSVNESRTRVRINSVSSLWSCDSKEKLWEAAGSGSWSSRDSGYAQIISSYTNRAGETARIYAVPFFKYVRKIYESLPDPVLKDEDLMEKVLNDAEGPRR